MTNFIQAKFRIITQEPPLSSEIYFAHQRSEHRNIGFSDRGKWKVKVLVTQFCPTLFQPHGRWPSRVLFPQDSPGKNTGVGCHALLQGIFPTQGSNLRLLHCRRILYPLSHLGSPDQCFKDSNKNFRSGVEVFKGKMVLRSACPLT